MYSDKSCVIMSVTVSAFSRALSVSEIKSAVKEAIRLQKDFPDVVAGFDMVESDLSCLISYLTKTTSSC